METFKGQLLVLQDKRPYRFMHGLTVMTSTLAILYLGGSDFGLGAFFLTAAILLCRAKKRFYIEFEYAVTHGELDVDIILERRKRSRALRIMVRDIDLLAPVESERYQSFPGHRAVKRLYPRGASGTEYALIHKGREFRLKPNEEMFRTLRRCNPTNIEE